MKRTLLLIGSASASLLMPFAVLAHSSPEGFILVLPSDSSEYTIKAGSTFNTITTTNNSFTIILDPAQQTIITSGAKKNLNNDQGIATVCNSSNSQIVYAAATSSSGLTIVTTPTGTCTVSTATATSGGSGGGSGGASGGGGSSSVTTTTTTATTTATTTPTASPRPSPTPSPTPMSPTSQAISTISGIIPSAPAPAVPVLQAVINRLLTVGSRGADVTALQQFLASDPSIYPEGTISGYYGAKTKVAVGRFQEKYDIASPGETGYGIVGPKTRAKLKELSSGISSSMPSPTPSQGAPLVGGLSITRTLVSGSRGADVTALQQFLATDPSVYPEGIVNGNFGPKTKAAVGRFQEKYGLAVPGGTGYGVVGPKTRAKLQGLSSGIALPSASSGSSGATVESLQTQLKILQDMMKKLQQQ